VAPALAASEGLVGGEDQGDVGLDAFAGQLLDGLEAFGHQRYLDDDVGRPLGQQAAFLDDLVGVQGDGLGADRARTDFDDLHDDVFEVAPGLGGQRGVGCHAINNAHGDALANFFYVRGIQKNLHRTLLIVRKAEQGRMAALLAQLYQDDAMQYFRSNPGRFRLE
jgi:hypothetical protein